jgi:hypothetical protein
MVLVLHVFHALYLGFLIHLKCSLVHLSLDNVPYPANSVLGFRTGSHAPNGGKASFTATVQPIAFLRSVL